MRRGTNIKNKCHHNFLLEILFVWIFIHEDCAFHPSSEKSFCCGRYSSSKCLPSQKKIIIFGMGIGHNSFMVQRSLVFSMVPNWFPWSFWFNFHMSQFQLFILGRSPILWFCSFNNILFIFMKGYNFLNIILWWLNSLQASWMPYFGTFVQNLLHLFFHVPYHYCQHTTITKRMTNYCFFVILKIQPHKHKLCEQKATLFQ